jgi:hypothetical protein
MQTEFFRRHIPERSEYNKEWSWETFNGSADEWTDEEYKDFFRDR